MISSPSRQFTKLWIQGSTLLTRRQSMDLGLLSGRMTAETKFDGDDLRNFDPKFEKPRFTQYLNAVKQLDQLAQE